MKKFVVCMIFFCLIFTCGVCLASSAGINTYGGTLSGDEVILDSMEQYEALIKDSDYQTEFATEYEMNIINDVKSYEESERYVITRAKVLTASSPKIQYYQDSSAKIHKYTFQEISVEILEGEYEGKTLDKVAYELTTDVYDNLLRPEVRKGEVVNLVLYTDEQGVLYGMSSGVDAPVARWHYVVILIVVAIVMVLIYTGTSGAKALISIFLSIGLLLLLFVPKVFDGFSIFILTVTMIAILSIVICTLRFGFNSKVAVAVLSSTCVCFLSMLFMYAFDFLTYISGVTLEASLISSFVPQRNVDFHALSISINVLVVFLASINIVCNAVEGFFENKTSRNAVEKVSNILKENVGEKLFMVASVLFVTLIPKYMYLYVKKYSLNEIVNSELLLADVLRILYAVIAMTIATPITVSLGKIVIDD